MKLISKFFVFLLVLLVGFIGCSGEDLKAPGVNGNNSSSSVPYTGSALAVRAFCADSQAAFSEGGESWVDVLVGNSAGLSALGNWKIVNASYKYSKEVLLSSSTVPTGWNLQSGDIIRLHPSGYSGSSDTTAKGSDYKWDYKYSSSYGPHYKAGMIWIEDGSGNIIDAVTYVTGAQTGWFETGSDAEANVAKAKSANQWPDTTQAAAVSIGDQSANLAVLKNSSSDGDSASDWQTTSTAPNYVPQSSSSSSSSSGSGGTVFNPSPSDPYYSYYSSAAGLSGSALKAKLKDIIDGHTDRNYDGLYTIYQTSDKTSDGKVWDMYSDRDGTGLNRVYTFSHTSGDRCGQYSVEGDCYNREHVIPQSKFGSSRPMVSDAHHVIPTDGKVNGMRSAYPHGDVSSASKTSQNGSKLGSCANSGYSGTVFEPVDAYKGDIARIYFYFCVRYYNGSISSWGSMNSGARLKSWAVTAYKAWHNADPVSAKERTRNDAIGASSAQGNRNPFIDYPQLVNMIDFTN